MALLQGTNYNLQGSGGLLQGSLPTLQGSIPKLQFQQNLATQTPSATATRVATTTQKDLSSKYGLINGTVYRKSDNYGFATPEEFFKDAGINNFNVKFDTNYAPTSSQPLQFQQSQPTPVQTPPVLPTQTKDKEDYVRNLANAYFETFKPSAGYTTASEKYTQSLQPSTEISAAKQAYQNTLAERDKLITGREGQGRGIPLGLIRGQQARDVNMYAPELQRLQGGIGIAQEEAEQASKMAKARLDYEKQLMDMGMTQNQAKLAFEQALLEQNKPVSVGSGSSLVDPKTGKLIYSGGSTGSDLYTNDYKNYLLSQQQGYKGTFEQWQNEDANRKRSITNISTGSNGLTPYQELNAILSIQGKLSTQTADARDAVGRYNQSNTAWSQYKSGKMTKNAVEQIIVNNFNKILDPTSVVREGEYARSAQGQSLLNRIDGYWYKLSRGGSLSDAELKGLIDGTGTLVQRYEQEITTKNQQAISTANQFGLPTNLIGTGGTQTGATTNPLGLPGY